MAIISANMISEICGATEISGGSALASEGRAISRRMAWMHMAKARRRVCVGEGGEGWGGAQAWAHASDRAAHLGSLALAQAQAQALTIRLALRDARRWLGPGSRSRSRSRAKTCWQLSGRHVRRGRVAIEVALALAGGWATREGESASGRRVGHGRVAVEVGLVRAPLERCCHVGLVVP